MLLALETRPPRTDNDVAPRGGQQEKWEELIKQAKAAASEAQSRGEHEVDTGITFVEGIDYPHENGQDGNRRPWPKLRYDLRVNVLNHLMRLGYHFGLRPEGPRQYNLILRW
jgi:hypothetical protein